MSAIPITLGLQLLLDARAITELNDGDSVASWADSSGNFNNASQATAANRPIYKTNIFGANPAVRHADSSDFVSGSFAGWSGGTGATFFLAASNLPSSNTASGRYFTIAPTGGVDASNYLLGVASSFEFWVGGSNRVTTVPLASAGVGVPIIFGGAVDSSNIATILNGSWRTPTHSFSLPSATQNQYATGFINGTPTAGFSCLADYHFLIAYNRRLSTSEISQVCQWIREELGIDTATGGGKPTNPFTQGVIG